MVSYISCSKRQSINGKEFDTYKIGTVANSTSTMHKLMSKPITRESFEMDDYKSGLKIPVTEKFNNISDDMYFDHDDMIDAIISYMEALREEYNSIIDTLKLQQDDSDYAVKLKERANWVWKELIRWLPESWLQTRTVTMNYENLLAICSKGQRRFHKLNEWSGKEDPNLTNFIAWARTLPYAQQFIFIDEMFVPTPAEVCGKALREICEKLATEQMTEQDFSTLGVTVLNQDGTFKSVYEILSELANEFDKNEIF